MPDGSQSLLDDNAMAEEGRHHHRDHHHRERDHHDSKSRRKGDPGDSASLLPQKRKRKAGERETITSARDREKRGEREIIPAKATSSRVCCLHQIFEFNSNFLCRAKRTKPKLLALLLPRHPLSPLHPECMHQFLCLPPFPNPPHNSRLIPRNSSTV